MEIIELRNENEIKSIVTDPSNKSLVVIDCGATWCGPCKKFGEFYHKFVHDFPKTDQVIFCKVDIDDVERFCELNVIVSVPTILFIKNGEVVDRIEGADTNKFKNILDNHFLPNKSNSTEQDTNVSERKRNSIREDKDLQKRTSSSKRINRDD